MVYQFSLCYNLCIMATKFVYVNDKKAVKKLVKQMSPALTSLAKK